MSEPIRENDPKPGFYKRRLVRGGPWMPARIWWEDGERDPETGALLSDQWLRCEVNGEPRDPFAEWTWLAGQPISEDEYRLMMAQGAWDRSYAPTSPAANPAQPINLLAVKPPF